MEHDPIGDIHQAITDLREEIRRRSQPSTNTSRFIPASNRGGLLFLHGCGYGLRASTTSDFLEQGPGLTIRPVMFCNLCGKHDDNWRQVFVREEEGSTNA